MTLQVRDGENIILSLRKPHVAPGEMEKIMIPKVKFALTLASNASGNTAGKEINVVHSHRPSDMKPIEDRVLDHGNPQYSVPLEVGLGLKVQFAR